MLISRDPCNFRNDSLVQNPLKLIKNEWDIIVFRTEIDFFFIHWFSIFSNFMRIGQWTSYSLNGVISRSLSRSRDFSFTITLRQKLKGVTRMPSLLVIQRCIRVTPLGFYIRVIVNEKHLNLENTMYIGVSVLL